MGEGHQFRLIEEDANLTLSLDPGRLKRQIGEEDEVLISEQKRLGTALGM
jgi:hypothetical protein